MSDLNLDMAPVAPTATLGGVPVIDMSAPRDTLVSEIAEACRDWGFFQVRGHGVPASVMTDSLDAA